MILSTSRRYKRYTMFQIYLLKNYTKIVLVRVIKVSCICLFSNFPKYKYHANIKSS